MGTVETSEILIKNNFVGTSCSEFLVVCRFIDTTLSRIGSASRQVLYIYQLLILLIEELILIYMYVSCIGIYAGQSFTLLKVYTCDLQPGQMSAFPRQLSGVVLCQSRT